MVLCLPQPSWLSSGVIAAGASACASACSVTACSLAALPSSCPLFPFYAMRLAITAKQINIFFINYRFFIQLINFPLPNRVIWGSLPVQSTMVEGSNWPRPLSMMMSTREPKASAISPGSQR